MKAKVFKPPMILPEDDRFTVFLGGSIEMGKAEDWQELITGELQNFGINILNPRRDDWDSSWEQDPTPGTNFYEQVTWELRGLEESDYRIFYFAKDTMSPISLMELGLHTKSHLPRNDEKMIVYVDENYSRKGNVIIFCNRYSIPFYQNREEFITKLKRNIESRINRHAEDLRS